MSKKKWNFNFSNEFKDYYKLADAINKRIRRFNKEFPGRQLPDDIRTMLSIIQPLGIVTKSGRVSVSKSVLQLDPSNFWLAKKAIQIPLKSKASTVRESRKINKKTQQFIDNILKGRKMNSKQRTAFSNWFKNQGELILAEEEENLYNIWDEILDTVEYGSEEEFYAEMENYSGKEVSDEEIENLYNYFTTLF